MGVAKGHLGHGHHISFSYFAAECLAIDLSFWLLSEQCLATSG